MPRSIALALKQYDLGDILLRLYIRVAIVELSVVPPLSPPSRKGEHVMRLFGEHPEDNSKDKESDQCKKREEQQLVVAEFKTHAISWSEDLRIVGWNQ
jgi:hypothetical protein